MDNWKYWNVRSSYHWRERPCRRLCNPVINSLWRWRPRCLTWLTHRGLWLSPPPCDSPEGCCSVPSQPLLTTLAKPCHKHNHYSRLLLPTGAAMLSGQGQKWCLSFKECLQTLFIRRYFDRFAENNQLCSATGIRKLYIDAERRDII